MIIDKVSIAPFKTGMNEILISYHYTKRAEVDEVFEKLLRKRIVELGNKYQVTVRDSFVVLDERAKHGVESLCMIVTVEEKV